MKYLYSYTSKKSNSVSSESGNAVVEFALVLPFLLLILFGIVNFGVLMYNQSVITNAAREGARWASIHTSTVYGTTCANAAVANPLDPCETAYSYAYNNLISFSGSNGLVVTRVMPADYNSGTPQSVTVAYTYTGIGWFFGGQAGKVYSSTSVMLHE